MTELDHGNINNCTKMKKKIKMKIYTYFKVYKAISYNIFRKGFRQDSIKMCCMNIHLTVIYLFLTSIHIIRIKRCTTNNFSI